MDKLLRYGSKVLRTGSNNKTTRHVKNSATPSPSPSTVWDAQLVGAQKILDIYPELWPQGAISQSAFQAATPFNSGHWKVTTQRFWRDNIPALGRDFIRFRDPKLDEGSSKDPWQRRVAPEVDWGAVDLVNAVGATPGKRAFTNVELYFPQHNYVGSGVEGWNPGFTIKFIDGWNLGSVGSTGNNPQTADGVCEVVFTSYGIKTLQNNSYDLNSKGDFGSWETGVTTIDTTGVYNPVLDINNFAHYSNYWFLGWGVYAHDTRQNYQYQNMLYPVWPGTNKRILFTVNTLYELRWMVTLNDPGVRNGKFYAEMRIKYSPNSLPPGIVLNEWFVIRSLTDVDWIGNSTNKWTDTGFGFFAGGGNGSSFGDNVYHPTPKPPYYDRNFYIGQKQNWVNT